MKIPSVYMAGKVPRLDYPFSKRSGQHVCDWRADLGCQSGGIVTESSEFAGLKKVDACDCTSGDIRESCSIWHEGHTYPYLYCGPWFGERHGTLEGCHAAIEHGQETFQRSVNCIMAADFVFAYISTGDAYGTIAEIGFSHGIGKLVFLVCCPDMPRHVLSDLWFVKHFATVVDGEYSLQKSFVHALNIWYQPHKELAGNKSTPSRRPWP